MFYPGNGPAPWNEGIFFCLTTARGGIFFTRKRQTSVDKPCSDKTEKTYLSMLVSRNPREDSLPRPVASITISSSGSGSVAINLTGNLQIPPVAPLTKRWASCLKERKIDKYNSRHFPLLFWPSFVIPSKIPIIHSKIKSRHLLFN